MKLLKTTLILFFSLITLSSTIGQDIKIGDNFYFIADQGQLSSKFMQLFNGDSIDAETEINAKDIIKVTAIDADTIYFKYFLFDTTKKNKKISKIKGDTSRKEMKIISKKAISTRNFELYNVEDNRTKIFRMIKKDFLTLTNKRYNEFRGFKGGAHTVPIRIRKKGKTFEYNSNVSLGASIIGEFGFKRRKYPSLDLSIGFGLTKVDLNTENSSLGTGDYQDIELMSPTALTFIFGANFNLSSQVNLGLYLGADYLSSYDAKTNWIYNKNAWIGIGINATIGSPDKSNSKTGSN